ncbi:(d)CMP kinase [Blautia glucerasea]|uniref:(d)CMP kinase n=1 Tax=Blautia glucerasea TaxID=536633 RepID=UPI001D073138|nr:(d)CMP kinase [Blautia glucerasea]MCB6544053.1 (d)CMP kinase [Blautia glucerasea]
MIYNIAIDGPAGAGKSTIARRVAKELSFIYVDTGAMYRAMALYLLRKEVNRDDTEQIGNICQDAEISIEYQNGEQIVLLNGENVNSYLRTEEVGNMASVSSAVPRVREKLLSLQRKLAKDMSVVMDGRDIGTTILPDADVKIYLTASSLTRARRRYLELQEKGTVCNLDDIQKDIEERDQRDMNREISPLRQAKDAVLVDSSDLTIQQVVDRILQIFGSKTTGEDSHES